MAQVIKEIPHFGLGHFCGGCGFNDDPHTGCVMYGNVEVQPAPKRAVKPEPLQPSAVVFVVDQQADIRL